MTIGSVMPPLLRAQLLGAFQITVDGRPIGVAQWRHGSAVRLIKLLLVTPTHRLRREIAAEQLWPEATPHRAGANLRRAQHFLRRAISADGTRPVLRADHREIGFDPDANVVVDLDMLIAAAHRVSTQLGREDPWDQGLDGDLEVVVRMGSHELLPGDLPEEWTIRLREQLLVRWERAAMVMAERALLAGHPGRAHEIAEQVLDRDPASEEAHRLLIRSLMLEGLPHAARRQMAACRRALREAFDVDPAPETIAALEWREPATVRPLVVAQSAGG